MDWLPITLLCAFSVAAADAVTKRWLSDYRAVELVLVRFGVTGLLLLPWLLLQPWPGPAAAFWLWIAALVPLEILAMALYMRAIRDNALALTLPYLAFTPVFTVLTGLLVLGERVSPQGLAGVLLVVAGAYWLNLERGPTGHREGWWAPFAAILYRSGSRQMLAVAALYSLTSVLGKGAMQYVGPTFFAPFYFCVLAAASVLLFGGRPRELRVLWRRPAWHLLLGVCMVAMVITHFIALQRVEVAYMIAVKRTSLLFGILFGALLFRESGLTRHLLAATLMLSGVALILL